MVCQKKEIYQPSDEETPLRNQVSTRTRYPRTNRGWAQSHKNWNSRNRPGKQVNLVDEVRSWRHERSFGFRLQSLSVSRYIWEQSEFERFQRCWNSNFENQNWKWSWFTKKLYITSRPSSNSFFQTISIMFGQFFYDFEKICFRKIVFSFLTDRKN